MNTQSHSTFLRRPGTRAGWWAVGLTAAFVGMYILNSALFMRVPEDAGWRQTLLPFYGIAMILCGLAGGVVGLVSLLRSHERSWLVWLTLLPGAMVLFLLVGEFLFPH